MRALPGNWVRIEFSARPERAGCATPADRRAPYGDRVDPALHAFLVELGDHVATEGWDQPPRLFAWSAATPWVPREFPIDAADGLDDALGSIAWDDRVAGCALVLEVLTLPSATQDELPDDRAAAQRFAADHPDRAELRVVVGVLRDGTRESTVRLRDEFRTDPVLFGADLATGVARILLATFAD